MLPSNLHCGVAGWSYTHWNSVVYPAPKPHGFHALDFLAGYFDVAEINTSFYQPLRPEVVRVWMAKVQRNPSFLFTVKLHRAFTHDRLEDREGVRAFKDGLWPLQSENKLGCLLMQFPWSFRFTQENRAYLIRLRRTFHEFPLVAELRHSSWMLEEAVGTLIDHRIGFCNIDQPPHTKATPAAAIVTSGTAYVRLHGRTAAAGWLDEYAENSGPGVDPYLYSQSDLEAWKQRIENIRAHASKTFVVFTNDAGASSAINALQLQALLGGRTSAPAELMALHPDELSGFRADRPVQSALFTRRQVA